MTAFKLNPEQTETLTALSNFANAYVLKGYAGTGKTTVITRWVEEIRKRPKDIPDSGFWRTPEIVLTAPTNKAAGVLKEKAAEIGLPVNVSTIHSLLSLKMRWHEGQQVLVQDDRGENRFNDYDYVVIDECSMLDKKLMTYIRNAQDSRTKVVFMGDPCQLPPIGEKESESFSESENLSELTQVMRQGKGNPIQDLALYLRETILVQGRAPGYPSKLFQFIDDKNIFHYPLASYEDQILEAFADQDSDRDIRHVAWTNRVVDAWNDKIRDKIYGFDREEWEKGEQIVTTSPVMDPNDGNVVFSTDTLLKIQRLPERTEQLSVPCWKIWCANKILFVVGKEGKRAFTEEKERLIQAAKQDKKEWHKFYSFIESFAYVKPAHSLTVHRSQGSTFDDAYVSYQNILANPNRKESLQCLYVAITRPRKRLFLV